jgi:hypothetical protein
MGRSTFEGPILSGDNRFGPLRDVGYAVLTQTCYIDFAVTTGNQTANYAGGSGQYVMSNTVPNQNAQLYTPSSVFNYVGPTTATPPTDTGTNVYRGVIMYLPIQSQIEDFIIDMPTVMSGITATPTGVNMYISSSTTANGGTPTYASVAIGTTTTGTAGRQTVAYSTTQLNNLLSTTSDIQNPQPGVQPSFFSQLVFTIGIAAASGLTAPTAGQFGITVRYRQADTNIGTGTAYPYGNFD